MTPSKDAKVFMKSPTINIHILVPIATYVHQNNCLRSNISLPSNFPSMRSHLDKSPNFCPETNYIIREILVVIHARILSV